MAQSCREQLVQVEVGVLQRVDRFVRELKQTCENQECVWYLLCLNKVICWMIWVVAKISEWVLILIIRWVYQIVCIIVSIVIGVVVLIFLGPDILIQAIKDLFIYILDAVLLIVGLVLMIGNNLIDSFLTFIKVQDKKRGLTKEEIEVLRPIFGDSIAYSEIRINEGERLGIMGPPFVEMNRSATTIGFNIYSRTTGRINSSTLVHECVHVWQFQFAGTHYIGQSVLTQILSNLNITRSPYFWDEQIGTSPNSWYLLPNVEAQAEFIQDLFDLGKFIDVINGPIETEGAFFTQGSIGQNQFNFRRDPSDPDGETKTNLDVDPDFTVIANEAWKIINTG